MKEAPLKEAPSEAISQTTAAENEAERERLKALYAYDIMDTETEEAYDNLTRIAARICGTPVSLISLIDPERQWFKAAHGMDATETPRDIAFCNHAIKNKDEVMEVPDASIDRRFKKNPLVTRENGIRFYAGAPLRTPNGQAIGTLCVIDQKPKQLTREQQNTLQVLADQVMILLELRRKNRELQEKEAVANEHIKELEKFAYVVSHDLKSPLNNIFSLSSLLRDGCEDRLDESEKRSLDFLQESAASLGDLIDGILNHYRSDKLLEADREHISAADLLDKVTGLFSHKARFSYILRNGIDILNIQSAPVQQILINLIANGLKYNDSKIPHIQIEIGLDNDFYRFSVKDDGRGIAEEDKDKIFVLFSTLSSADRNNKHGTGIGLATVKKLTEKLGGEITVDSEPGKGSTFSFTAER